MWEEQTVTNQHSDEENQAGRATDSFQVHRLPGHIRKHHKEQRPLGYKDKKHNYWLIKSMQLEICSCAKFSDLYFGRASLVLDVHAL